VHNFIVISQPKSYNAKKSDSYRNRIQAAFRRAHPAHKLLYHDLYGLIYHFYKSDIRIDADNISKPIWDSLTGILFADDKQVKMRIAGSVDLSSNDLTTLDLSGLSGYTITELLEATEFEDHVLYIECGSFSMDMVRLNLERNGN
jgi:hypothetical protein